MKVFADVPLHPAALEALAAAGAEVVGWDDPRLSAWAEEAEALINGPMRLDAAAFARARRLKVVAKHGTGIDNIDLKAARARKVRVARSPGGNAQSVTELAVGLAVALARRIVESDARIRSLAPFERGEFTGFDLRGKAAGIVGVGAIGRRVARLLAQGFGMAVSGYDPYLSADDWRRRDAARVARLDDLLARVDLLTLHCPLTDETRGLIGEAELERMKPSAILVNTARGGIVDEPALFSALSDGRLAGAALDVFAAEPPPADHPLFALPNVIATRHVGGYSEEALKAIGLKCVRQILDALAGREPEDAVA
ncbi:MAG: hydroxyacid dehydrogenase [Proteobacteria bacterium]|nr:hydroxyacid dehydrogenase [Pseudomonadota bacterium]